METRRIKHVPLVDFLVLFLVLFCFSGTESYGDEHKIILKKSRERTKHRIQITQTVRSDAFLVCPFESGDPCSFGIRTCNMYARETALSLVI